MFTTSLQRNIAIMLSLAFFMLLTRGSHVLTAFSLPDASLIVFLLGGIWVRRWSWFALLFILAAVIDFGSAAFNPYLGFCLTDGYWGMIPTYAAMWLGGLWLARQAQPFKAVLYFPVAAFTTLLAFVISTQTYYLFSGRFPNQGLQETILHGWNYLPGYMAYAMMYAAIVCLGVSAWKSIAPTIARQQSAQH